MTSIARAHPLSKSPSDATISARLPTRLERVSLSVMSRTLEAPVTVAFDYTRSVGPVLGRFFTGLSERRLVGARLADGGVAVPPPEFDPVSHAAPADFVEVG